MVFHAKTIFFPGRKLVLLPKTITFPRENQTNHLVGVCPRSVSKDGFFGFVWFSLGKVGF